MAASISGVSSGIRGGFGHQGLGDGRSVGELVMTQGSCGCVGYELSVPSGARRVEGVLDTMGAVNVLAAFGYLQTGGYWY